MKYDYMDKSINIKKQMIYVFLINYIIQISFLIYTPTNIRHLYESSYVAILIIIYYLLINT